MLYNILPLMSCRNQPKSQYLQFTIGPPHRPPPPYPTIYTEYQAGESMSTRRPYPRIYNHITIALIAAAYNIVKWYALKKATRHCKISVFQNPLIFLNLCYPKPPALHLLQILIHSILNHYGEASNSTNIYLH